MQENIAFISLKNIKHNLLKFQNLLSAGVKLYAVVKANAYGHGAERVAQSVQEQVDGFVVTAVQEGICLRFAGVYKEILVLTPPIEGEDVFLAHAHALTLTVCSFASLRVLIEGVQKFGVNVKVHLKINTGMNRLGLSGSPLKRLCSLLTNAQGVQTQGVYSHLYAPAEQSAAEKQRVCFLNAKKRVEEQLGPLVCHLSATGGVLRGEKYYFNGVRIGIGMYGYLPCGFERWQQSLSLRPAMKLYTHALQTHRFTGGGVGYAQALEEYRHLTVYRLGYADGFLRSGGGGNINAVGNLCMDSCIQKGKSAYGKRRAVFSSATPLAKRTNTISYEVLCNATKRASFEYVEC